MLKQYNVQFLDHLTKNDAADNDAGPVYGVGIQPADVSAGETYWQVIGVHHLTPDENNLNHHVYIEALDETGNRVADPNVRAGWSWEGQKSDEKAPPAPLDKGADEPAGNIALEKHQVTTVWITNQGPAAADKSDRVTHLDTQHADERNSSGGLGNSIFHHSFYVVFQRTRKGAGHAIQPGGGQVVEPQQPTPQPAESLPGGATVAFDVEPKQIKAPQSATVRWDVEGVDKVFFQGQGVTGHESRTVAPAATTTYTLRVHFRDGSTREFAAQVTVEAAAPQPQPVGPSPSEPALPPGGTRPPTVRLTPENIAHLRTYPRPPADNGRGLHFHLDLSDDFITETVGHLQSIHATWTLICAQDANQARRAAEPCWRAGIMPVVRVGRRVDAPDADPAPYVEALKAIGVPPYVQVYNEPEDGREWKTDDDRVGTFGRNWARGAARVYDAGGYPGLQVLSREMFDAAVNAVQAQGLTKIWQRAVFIQHNYAENHPPAYPYDERKQKESPGLTIHQDNLSVLAFLDYAAWMQERIGFVLPIIGGEGGWLFGAEKDSQYPKVERALHAQYHREMFDWLRTGVLINGEPLPDYVFSITPWIAGSWTFAGQNWWGNAVVKEGRLVETIEAVQAIPPYIRKFSWDL